MDGIPFDYNIQYVKGTNNKVADSLSRYYQSDTWEDVHPSYHFVNADLQLDPEGEDLPWNCIVELCTICNEARNHPIREVIEGHDVLVEQLANTKSQAE